MIEYIFFGLRLSVIWFGDFSINSQDMDSHHKILLKHKHWPCFLPGTADYSTYAPYSLRGHLDSLYLFPYKSHVKLEGAGRTQVTVLSLSPSWSAKEYRILGNLLTEEVYFAHSFGGWDVQDGRSALVRLLDNNNEIILEGILCYERKKPPG
jgi:hypothetical protein